jgi:hypothetical protein
MLGEQSPAVPTERPLYKSSIHPTRCEDARSSRPGMSELPWLRMVLPAESEALAAPTEEDQDAVAAGPRPARREETHRLRSALDDKTVSPSGEHNLRLSARRSDGRASTHAPRSSESLDCSSYSPHGVSHAVRHPTETATEPRFGKPVRLEVARRDAMFMLLCRGIGF